LRDPGVPLADEVQAAMGGRFGHDFSHVRVHTGAGAAESATAVRAAAYTVGQHIVFAAGQYAPASSGGTRLLAHELAHTIQQGEPASVAGLALGDARDSLEQEADRVAETVTSYPPAPGRPPRLMSAGGRVQRQLIAVPNSPVPLAGSYSGYQSTPFAPPGPPPTVVPPQPAHRAATSLNDADRTLIGQILQAGPPPGPAPAVVQGARFVLHDTAGSVGASWIAEKVAAGRGPLGEGAAAYVPRAGSAQIARQQFFERRRPAATQFERINDLMAKPEREAAYRAVWQASSTSAHTAALAAALAGLRLTAPEVTAESAKARSELEGQTGDVHTTGSWAASEICAAVAAQGAAAVAASPAEVASLTAGCATLAPVIAARRVRLGSTVNVEMVQAEGSVTPGRGPALPHPAYTASQYDAVARVYLEATLQAGRWPGITTHFAVDRGSGDHVDPRCFDLGNLYRQIAALMHHGPATSYGAAAVYGTAPSCNVWWDPTVCGAPPPP
jgi:hypothetical protein